MYELLVRESLVKAGNMPVGVLHQKAVEQVRASYQSKAYELLEEILTPKERATLKRGRNSNGVKPPKNGNLQDYRRATGVECLFGYLYLEGENDRINQLFLFIKERVESEPVVNEHIPKEAISQESKCSEPKI